MHLYTICQSHLVSRHQSVSQTLHFPSHGDKLLLTTAIRLVVILTLQQRINMMVKKSEAFDILKFMECIGGFEWKTRKSSHFNIRQCFEAGFAKIQPQILNRMKDEYNDKKTTSI